MKKIIIFISISFTISSLFFFKSSPCQNKMHWNWVERDTVFTVSGIYDIPKISCVKFVDIDQDSKVELVVGVKGDMRLYQNAGSMDFPNWRLVPGFFEDIEDWITKGFDFEDVDNDGHLECISTYYYYPVFLKNLGSFENPDWQIDSLSFRYQFIPDLGTSSIYFPELVDFDKDGDFDIAVVRYNNFGMPGLVYYDNIGSNDFPVWQLDDKFFNGCAKHYGTISPTFVDIDNDDDFDLFYQSIIEEFSFMKCYENVANQDSIQWKEFDFPKPVDDFTNYGVYDFDWHDVDHDDDLDLIISNGTRSLYYFENTGSSNEPHFEEHANTWGEFEVGHRSCVFVHDFDGDRNYDLAIFGYSFGFVNDYLQNRSYKNIRGNMPEKHKWQEVNWLHLDYLIDSGACSVWYLTIAPFDFDQDNDIDISVYVSASQQPFEMVNCFLLYNKGDNTNFDFEINSDYFDTLNKVKTNLRPTFGDLDGDGDADMMGIDSGKVIFFENVGIKNKYTIESKPNWAAGDTLSLYGRAQFIDLDYDEDLDMVQGFANGSFMCYFNEGSKLQPFWRKDTTVFAGVQTDQWSSPFIVDFDHDGDLDLISGNSWGGVHYFENQGYLSVQEAQFKEVMDFQLYQNYPNPFNSQTQIQYQIVGHATAVRIDIFNILGEKIKTLVNEIQHAGNYSVIWNGNDKKGCAVSGGIYFCKLQVDNFSDVKKLLLVR